MPSSNLRHSRIWLDPLDGAVVLSEVTSGDSRPTPNVENSARFVGDKLSDELQRIRRSETIVVGRLEPERFGLTPVLIGVDSDASQDQSAERNEAQLRAATNPPTTLASVARRLKRARLRPPLVESIGWTGLGALLDPASSEAGAENRPSACYVTV